MPIPKPRPVTKPRQGAPWEPPKWEQADVSAFQALQRGDASPDQQQRAIKYLLHDLTRIPELSFWIGQDGQRGTDFAEGRRFVGLQIAKFLTLNLGAFTKGGISKSEHRSRGNTDA